MNRTEKEQMVAELSQKLAQAPAAFVADYRGVTVEQVTKLRADLRNAGVDYRVAKNTLLRLATKSTGTTSLDAYLSGPTAIAFAGSDPVAPAKILSDFAKTCDKFELKGGILNGKALSVADVKALAELPSREELLSRMLSSLNAPVSNFVGVMAAIPRSLVNVLTAIRDQKAA